MADDIRVTTAGAAGGGTTAASRTTMPNDPEAARAEIQATRARISDTIDEIEDVLLHKKEEIQDRLDVLAPIRERPMQTLGIIFGAGLLLGLLTGGDDEDDRPRAELGDGERAETWERRARRLLRVAQEQEEELERLREHHAWHHERSAMREEREAGGEPEPEPEGEGVFDRLQEALARQLSRAVQEAVQRMIRS